MLHPNIESWKVAYIRFIEMFSTYNPWSIILVCLIFMAICIPFVIRYYRDVKATATKSQIILQICLILVLFGITLPCILLSFVFNFASSIYLESANLHMQDARNNLREANNILNSIH